MKVAASQMRLLRVNVTSTSSELPTVFRVGWGPCRASLTHPVVRASLRKAPRALPTDGARLSKSGRTSARRTLTSPALIFRKPSHCVIP